MNPTALSLNNLSLEFKVALAYAEGKSTENIAKEYPEVTDRKDVTRKLRKVLKVLLKDWQVNEAINAEATAEPILTSPEL
jgi:hypothetical protein